mmetsp:Transcript_79729/g.221901  ORF Transcript_79729/g.221901 Transcript_79729/m.221901 type:complete len:517 (-) Transcript_79729:73-1623(-)
MASVPSSGAGALMRQTVADQLAMVALFFHDKRLRAPMLAIWVATFGGALHEPVTTFFMLELGATTAQMGKFGVIRAVGAWVLGPIYGWMVDKYTAFLPAVLSGLFCAVGCLIRGFAPVNAIGVLYVAAVVLGLGAGNFWNVVGTHVACSTKDELRPLVVSAYFVQVTSLQLVAQLLYPAWDKALVLFGIDETFVRYRISMSICTFFCIFGMINVLVNGGPMREVKSKAMKDVDVHPASDAHSTETQAEKGGKEQRAPAVEVTSCGHVLSFLVLGFVLVVQAAAQIVVSTLWPLFVSRQFGWADREYAWLGVSGKVAAILAASAMPTCAQRVGAPVVATLLCGASAAGVLVGFAPDISVFFHVAGALVFIGGIAALKPCLEAIASLRAPAEVQGRSFAAFSLCNAVGQMVGSYCGTRLYEESDAHSLVLSGFLQTGGGALPFVAIGTALFASTSMLAVALLPSRTANLKASKTQDPAPTCEESSLEVIARVTPEDIDSEINGLLRRPAKPRGSFDGN